MAGLSFKERWIYGLYTWWGRFGSAPFSLSDALNRRGRLLVCLPSETEEARKAVGIIPGLITCLRAEVVFVVGNPRSLDCCDLKDDRVRKVPLDQNTRLWSGLPSTEIVDQLAVEGLNFAADLNPCAELWSSVLCLRTNAPIRLCLDDPLRKRFFNIHILLADEHSQQDRNIDKEVQFDFKHSDTRFISKSISSRTSLYARMLRVIQYAVDPHSVSRLTSTTTIPNFSLYARLARVIKQAANRRPIHGYQLDSRL